MRTFDSQHYRIIKFVPGKGWLIISRRDDSYLILAKRAKFVDAGKVVYLQEDGSVEDKTRTKVSLLNTED